MNPPPPVQFPPSPPKTTTSPVNLTKKLTKPPRREPAKCLVFAPLAWLKLMFFLHAGDTEIGGFAISSESNSLYIEQFITVEQTTSCVTVEFGDEAVANYFDECVDAGLKPGRFARIWCHTHPGESPTPSLTDEHTFDRVFGSCDWSLMFIIGRTGRTYARLSFAAGPGAHVLLPVAVDWAAWPEVLADSQLDPLIERWQQEFDAHIHPERRSSFSVMGDPNRSGIDMPDGGLGWWDYEDYEPRHSFAESEAVELEERVRS